MSYQNELQNYHYQTDYVHYKDSMYKHHYNSYHTKLCYNCYGNHLMKQCPNPCKYCKKIHSLDHLCFEFTVDKVTEIEHRVRIKNKCIGIRQKLDDLEKLPYNDDVQYKQQLNIEKRINRIRHILDQLGY